MAIWRATFKFIDRFDGETSKTFEGDFIDYAAASAAAGSLNTALGNASDAGIVEYTLAEVVPVATAPGGDSNVFERVSATMDMGAGKKSNFQLPSPVDALFNGNALDVANAQWLAVESELTAGGSGWFISDGENVVDTIAGKRVFVRSGSTNLR